MFNFKGFKTLCQATHDDLLEWLYEQLKDVYGEDNIIYHPRWAYFKGKSPACLCAHLDTVHKKTIVDMYIEPEKNIIHSPEGIGGDDRCGVWIILKILKSLKEGDDLPNLFFSTDEETGSASTKLACDWIIENNIDLMSHIRFFIQLDRKNEQDSVYYNCDNKDFEKYINSYGFKTAYGTRTDICILCDKFGKAGVNLSCGFNSEHSISETVSIDIMENTAGKVLNILAEADKDVIYDYKEKTPSYNSVTPKWTDSEQAYYEYCARYN